MIRKKISLTLFIIFFSILFLNQSVYSEEKSNCTINREHALLRSGPGSYYPSIAELPSGMEIAIIEETNGWYKINVDSLTGYVAKKITEGKTRRNDFSSHDTDTFAQMGKKRAVKRVNQAELTAGIKGLGGKFCKNLKGDKKFVEIFVGYSLDSDQFSQFRFETYKNMDLNKIRNEVELPELVAPTYFTFEEDAMGIGIAAAISEMGLYQNKSVQDYVNFVGNLVVQASNAYDIPFKFFILDIPQPNAYSCPGGIIFITKGLLDFLENEAELACVLGHEITHVSCYHGMKELEERKVQIIAEDSFADLDEETEENFGPMDDSLKAVEEELESMSMSIYGRIFAGRYAEYEEEADKYGIIYATRAGYDPRSMADLLQRLIASGKTSNNEHFTHEQMVQRKALIQISLNNSEISHGLVLNRERLKSRLTN
ncbi:MAG: M48 family metalloprotease [Candidatus Cloacimonadota bacterium]|nr:M48 family metalloprotease [Candidatus Cloacimonadota bacterium]